MEPRVLRPQFVAELQTLAKNGGRFHVGLGHGTKVDLPPSEFADVCATVIAPLLQRAVQCRVFEQPENALSEMVRPIMKAHGKQLELDLTKNVITGYERFWGADQWQRGSIAWQVPYDPALLERVFLSSRDPGFFTNVRTIAGAAAANHARKATEADEKKVVFVLAANRGLNELHVFAHRERILDALDVAMKSCRRSDRFLRLYGE